MPRLTMHRQWRLLPRKHLLQKLPLPQHRRLTPLLQLTLVLVLTTMSSVLPRMLHQRILLL